MEYVYAILFLHKIGKDINEENLTKLFEAVGAQADPAMVKAVVAAAKEIDIDEAIKSAAFPMAMPAAQAAAPVEKKEEEKKEEEKKEEEEVVEGLSALFG